MTIFKDYTFKWWQIGVLKVAVACFGIAIGANWPEVFAPNTILLLVLAVVLGIYVLAVVLKNK